MGEGREAIFEEAEWPSTPSKCKYVNANGGKASMYVEINRCFGELED